MNCDTVHEHLAEHATGALAPPLAVAIDAHARTCRDCDTLLSQARSLAPLVEAALAVDPPRPAPAAPPRAPIAPPRPSILGRPGLAWTCAVLCALAAVAGWTRPASEPHAAPTTWTASPKDPVGPSAPALSLARARQVDLATHADASIPMRFAWTDKIDPAALARRATATTQDGRRVAIEAVPGEPAHEVGLRFQVEPGVRFVLQIEAGLAGESGQVLPSPLSCELVLARDLVLTDHDVDWSEGEPAIELVFNAPVDPASVRSRIACEPAVDFACEVHGTRVVLSGAFAPTQRYRVTVSPGIATHHGTTVLDRPTDRVVWIGARPIELAFAFAGRYLSSAGTGRIHVAARGLSRFEVEVWRLYPENVAVLANDLVRLKELGRRIATREIEVEPRPDRATTVALSLDEVAGSARGILLLVLEPTRKDDGGAIDADCRWDQRRHTVVVASDLGVSCRLAGTELLCWTTSILRGASVEGATVRAMSRKNRELARGTTDGSGLARLTLAPPDTGDALALVTAELGDDLTYHVLERGLVARPTDGAPYCAPNALEAFVTAGRGMHRPGDTVALDALVRDRAGMPPGTFPVELALAGPDGRVRAKATASLDAQGGASATLVLDPAWPGGRWTALVRMPGSDVTLGSTPITVAAFVPEALAITLSPPPGRPRANTAIEVPVGARYLFGEAAADLRVQGVARWARRALDVGAHRGWSFGVPTPARDLPRVTLDDRTTDATGTATLVVPPLEADVGCAVELELEACVLAPDQRPTRQVARIAVDAHARHAALRVALGSPLAANAPVAFDLALVDGAGELVPGAHELALTWVRVHHDYVLERSGRGYHYRCAERTEPVDAKATTVVTDGRGATSFRPPHAGRYRLVATGPDTCPAALEISIWGDGATEPIHDATVLLALDRERHDAGELAHVAVTAPFAGLLLLAVETDRVEWATVRQVPAGRAVVDIPVAAGWGAGAHVTATLVRPATAHRGKEPARASGATFLAIDTAPRRIDVALDVAPQARSGRPFAVVLRAHSRGAPLAGARVKLAAIDVGALAIDRAPDPDPYARFCAARALGVRESDLFDLLLPELPAGEAADAGGGEGPSGAELSPIHAERFRVTAFHAPATFTDADGAARIEVSLPRHHGAVRVLVWVACADRFGNAAANVELTSPVMVELALPRFLAPEDTCAGALVVRNRTDHDADVALAVATQGPLAIEALPATVRLAAGATLRVPVAARALAGAGVGRVTATAAIGADADEQTIELPVRPAWPRTTIVRAGVVQAPARLVLEPPGDWFAGTASSTLALGAVPGLEHAGALDALVGYPHGCLEQTTSRALALLTMGAVAGLVVPGSPTPEELAHRIDGAIARIGTMQRPNGMLAWWPNAYGEYDYGSVYAADFLLAAKARGHAVPPHLLEALLDALERQADRAAPASRAEWGLDAYRAAVLRQAARRVDAALGRLEAVHAEMLDATGRAHFARALAASGETALAGSILAATTTTIAARGDDLDDLRSDAKERAALVLALVEVAPRDPRIDGLVGELARALARPDELTTQDLAWALRAVERAAHAEPARWTATLRHVATGRVAGTLDASRAMSIADAPGGMALDVLGEGPLRWCWIARGVPARAADPVSTALTVARRYVHARTGREVSPDALVVGERYRVTLELTLDRRTSGIVVSELLPAGLELEGTDTATRTRAAGELEPRPQIVRIEERDDRVVVFCDLPLARAAPWSFEYTVRAVTPGTYALPPVAAEAMYDPGLRCLGALGRAVVAPR